MSLRCSGFFLSLFCHFVIFFVAVPPFLAYGVAVLLVFGRKTDLARRLLDNVANVKTKTTDKNGENKLKTDKT